MPPIDQFLSLLEPEWLTWAVPAILFSLAVLSVGPALTRRLRPWRLHRRLCKLGRDVLHGVLLDDGMDGKTSIDYLILRPEGVLMIELKPYRGVIFGGKDIDQWTQVIGARSFKFPNPLHKQQNDALAVKAAARGVPVTGRLLFTGESQFPKGIPDSVLNPEALFEEFGAAPGEVSEVLQGAWADLKRAAVPVRARGPAGEPLDAAPPQSSGLGAGLAYAALGVGWLVWRLAA